MDITYLWSGSKKSREDKWASQATSPDSHMSLTTQGHYMVLCPQQAHIDSRPGVGVLTHDHSKLSICNLGNLFFSVYVSFIWEVLFPERRMLSTCNTVRVLLNLKLWMILFTLSSLHLFNSRQSYNTARNKWPWILWGSKSAAT